MHHEKARIDLRRIGRPGCGCFHLASSRNARSSATRSQVETQATRLARLRGRRHDQKVTSQNSNHRRQVRGTNQTTARANRCHQTTTTSGNRKAADTRANSSPSKIASRSPRRCGDTLAARTRRCTVSVHLTSCPQTDGPVLTSPLVFAPLRSLGLLAVASRQAFFHTILANGLGMLPRPVPGKKRRVIRPPL